MILQYKGKVAFRDIGGLLGTRGPLQQKHMTKYILGVLNLEEYLVHPKLTN